MNIFNTIWLMLIMLVLVSKIMNMRDTLCTLYHEAWDPFWLQWEFLAFQLMTTMSEFPLFCWCNSWWNSCRRKKTSHWKIWIYFKSKRLLADGPSGVLHFVLHAYGTHESGRVAHAKVTVLWIVSLIALDWSQRSQDVIWLFIWWPNLQLMHVKLWRNLVAKFANNEITPCHGVRCAWQCFGHWQVFLVF